MNRYAPGLALAAAAGVLLLAIFYVPPTPGGGAGGAVATADVKGVEGGLAALKTSIEAGNAARVQADLARTQTNWSDLKTALAPRNLGTAPSTTAFERSLVDLRAAVGQDKAMATQALRASTSAFSQVKKDLQSTAVLEIGRFLPAVGGLLLLWVLSTLALPRLADRLALKQ